MGLFGRIGQIFSGKAHDAVDAVEDPSSLGRQIIRQLDEKINDAQVAFNKVQGQLFLIQDDLDKAKEAVEKWSAATLKADQQGKQDLVLECIERLQEAEANVASYQTQYDTVKASADALEDQLDQLNKERNKSANQVRVMQTTVEVAEAQSVVADAMVSADTTGLTNDLGRLQRKVDEQSANARAQIATQQRKSGDDILNQLDEIGKESTSDVLARLKGKQA